MYTVAVKIEGMDRRRRTTGLMHLVIGCFLLLKCITINQQQMDGNEWKLLPFFIVAGISIGYGALRSRLDAKAKYNGAVRLLQFMTFISMGVMTMQGGRKLDYFILFVWAAVTFMLFISEKKIFAQTFIKFTGEGILVPGTYREHLVSWESLEDVTVRHDFITLFHHQKKYLQYQVIQDLSELEVVKINTFCREKTSHEKPEAE